MIIISLFLAVTFLYKPATKKNDTYTVVLRTPKPCGLKGYEGVLTFIKSPERDQYDLAIEYGYNVPTLVFMDVDEQELGRIYIHEDQTAEEIRTLLDAAEIPVRK